jgi:hypothetical protein
MGDFPGAASLIAETDNVAAATGSRQAPYALLRLLALQGKEAEAGAAIAGAIEQAGPAGQGMAAAWAQWAAAVLYNGLARYEEAASAARQATVDPVNWWSMWVLPEDAWADLMQRLGYSRYVAQGGDWGGHIVDVMSVQAPAGLLGIHTNFAGAVPPDVDQAAFVGGPAPPGLSAEEPNAYDQLVFFYTNGLAYTQELANHPQTMYGIADSSHRLGRVLPRPRRT